MAAPFVLSQNQINQLVIKMLRPLNWPMVRSAPECPDIASWATLPLHQK